MRFALIWFLLAACGGVQTGQPLQSRQDVDHDEVPDVIDKCPYDPGPDANSGCPLKGQAGNVGGPDSDNDGVADRADKCPNEPEDRDGYQDDDGCPEVDNDRDGVADVVDRCPNEPARTPDGCPTTSAPATTTPPPTTPAAPANPPATPPTSPAAPANPPTTPATPPVSTNPPKAPGDRDGDGLADASDRCPDLAEDRDGYDDSDGCPEPDNDSDGVPDVSDRCPNLPESKNNKDDSDGCPD